MIITMKFQDQGLSRSFARRIGKRLGKNSKYLLENILPEYQYSESLFLNSPYTRKFLEIGFGMGEHLFHQINQYPGNLYIGAEVYLNGVAKFLHLATNENLNNFLIWPDDLDLILPRIPDKSLDGIYILFPDPWHKRKYLKKRLVSKERLTILKSKLKDRGFIAFTSDIEDYFNHVQNLCIEDPDFLIQNTDYTQPHPGYITTKYHHKAIRENRVAKFLQAILVND